MDYALLLLHDIRDPNKMAFDWSKEHLHANFMLYSSTLPTDTAN